RRRSACAAAPAPRCEREVLRSDPDVARSATRWRSSAPPTTPVARSSLCPPCSAPAPDEPVRSPLFSEDVLDHLVLEHLLGQQLLQPAVLGLELPQPLGVG